MQTTDFIKRCSFFNELNEDNLLKIASISTERNYKRNMIIFMEGEPGDALYYIKSGKVKVFRTYEDGREHIIHVFGEGEVFGEATLFNRVSYPASAEVYEDAVIGMIKNDRLEALIAQNPDLALNIIRILSRKLVFAQNKIKDLAYNDVFTRTASQLIILAGDFGKRTDSGTVIDLQLSRQQLADMIGTTRETVSRVISKFRKEKSISEQNNNIVILDIAKLKKWI